jgi:hypothetical protein
MLAMLGLSCVAMRGHSRVLRMLTVAAGAVDRAPAAAGAATGLGMRAAAEGAAEGAAAACAAASLLDRKPDTEVTVG